MTKIIVTNNMTTTKNVADTFGKDHKNVLSDVKKMKCSGEFRGLNLKPSSYTSSQNKVLPCFDLTKDGFVLLVMKYTGADAMEFKEAYIKAFNQLAIQASSVSNLLLEAQKLMGSYKEKGKGWSDFGRELKRQKPLIECALQDAEKLTQLELKL